MLSSASLSNDSLLAELYGQQGLADGIVDLVGASVSQLLALEPDLCTAAEVAESLCMVQRGGAADEVLAEPRQLSLELRIHLPLLPGHLQLVVRHHQSLRNETTAEDGGAKVPLVSVLFPFRLFLVAERLLPLCRRLGLRASKRAAAQRAHEASHSGDAILAKLLHNLRADNTAIGESAELLHVLSLGDAEANDHRKIALLVAMLLGGITNRLHHRLALCEAVGLRFCFLAVSGARDTQQRNDVDHARQRACGSFGNLGDALCAASGRGQRNQAQVVCSSSRGHNSPGLFHGKIHNDETVDAGC
mmetsp:Transcript_8216/g.19649  ORF Transcript_8216/g.19649 Transcript_8216/m.19649 type:complete len:304 (-) Transcript_8216:430-1341(-)